MAFRGWSEQRLARQLAHPRGFFGRRVASELNIRNQARISGAVAMLGLSNGRAAADIGFGGGLGIGLLLEQVGTSGKVHAIDQSDVAIGIAHRTYAEAIRSDRLIVRQASMTELPIQATTLDGAITINTVYFLDDEEIDAAFHEFARVLRPPGMVVIGIGNPGAMALDPLMAHGFRIRTVDALLQHASKSGLVQTAQQEVGDPRAPAYLLGLSKALVGQGG